MPASVGQVVSTLPNETGNTIVALAVFYDPNTRLLRDSTYVTVQDGTKAGALIVDNATARTVKIVLTNDANGNSRSMTIPARGSAFTANQLSKRNMSTLDDVNGFTFSLA